MKKLILILITLTTFSNVSYASFPIPKNTHSEVLISQVTPQMDDNGKILLLSLLPIPAAIIGAILFSAGRF